VKRCLSCKFRFAAASWRCPDCGWQPVMADGHCLFAPEIAEENAGFSAAYFENLARRESGYFWFESRNQLICWALAKYFPAMRSLLEIGCGTGFVLAGISRSFPGVPLSGSEALQAGLLYTARRLPRAELFQMDARNIPFVEEFDVIGAFDVLEHIDEDRAVLEQIHAAVKPGGGMVLTVPQHPALWSGIDEYSFHKRRYTREDLVRKVSQAGFRTVRATSFVTILLPAMVATRLLRRRYTKDFDLDLEFRISVRMNRSLTRVLAFERRVIQTGISLPVGGSLLLVARRDQEG